LPYDGHVKLLVYSITGEVIKELVNQLETAGYKEVHLDAGKLSSGVYFYSIFFENSNGNNFISAKKAILLK
jgi:hypothetical protein